jgi:hypothetical protein
MINQYLSTLTYTDPTTATLQKIFEEDIAGGSDDTYFEVALPFPINYFGSSYNSVFVSSNGYITFGAGSSSNPDWTQDLIEDEIPFVSVAAGDDRIKELWVTNSELSADAEQFRIRFNGWYPYDIPGYGDEPPTPANLTYDFTFYKNLPEQIDLQIISQPVTGIDIEVFRDQEFIPNVVVSEGFSILALADNAAEQGFRITASLPISYPYLSGLEGILYNGYFEGNPEFFKTATTEGTTEVRNTFSGISETVDASWQWTGYILSPETNYYCFNGSSDHAFCMWFGASALEANYSASNMLVSADNYQNFDTREERVTFAGYTQSTNEFTFAPEVSAKFSYLSAGSRVAGYSQATDTNFVLTVASRDTITGTISATSDVIGQDDISLAESHLKIPKGILLQGGEYYPVRIQWGHPPEPTGANLYITFRQLDGYDAETGETYDTNSTSDWTGLAWRNQEADGLERIWNIYGGLSNYLRLRLLGHF